MANNDGQPTLIEANQWTANQYKFLQWLALPSRARMPLMQQQLAIELGVHEVTLCKWRKLPGFEATLLELIKGSIGNEANEIMASFIDEAKKGQYQQQKQWFEMMNWYTPKEIRQNEGEIVVKHTRMPIDKIKE